MYVCSLQEEKWQYLQKHTHTVHAPAVTDCIIWKATTLVHFIVPSVKLLPHTELDTQTFNLTTDSNKAIWGWSHFSLKKLSTKIKTITNKKNMYTMARKSYILRSCFLPSVIYCRNACFILNRRAHRLMKCITQQQFFKQLGNH